MKPKGYYQKYKAPRVHVQIWEASFGPVPKGFVVDHRDGDIHNNAIDNLRLATRSQNAANAKTPTNNKTGLKGLSLLRSGFRGTVTVNKKQQSFFSNDLLEVAAWIYRTRRELHGEFARCG